MRYPRLGTPAGNRAFSSAQMAYDNLTPEDIYGPEEDETETDQMICDHASEPCADDCEHGSPHSKCRGCGPAVCVHTGKSCYCVEV